MRRRVLVAVPGRRRACRTPRCHEIPGAAAGDDRDRRTGAAAVLGLEVRGLHRISAIESRPARRSWRRSARVLVGHAVIRKLNDVRPLMERLFMFSHPGASRIACRSPRQQLQHAREVAALEGDVLDILAVISPERAPLVVCTCTASDWTETVSDTPPTSSAIRRSRGDRSHRASIPLFVGLEPLHGDGQIERARQQVGKHKSAIGPGHGVAREAGADVLDGDGDARQHAAGRVGDGPGDSARSAPAPESGREAKSDERSSERHASEAIAHEFSSSMCCRRLEVPPGSRMPSERGSAMVSVNLRSRRRRLYGEP